MPEALSCEGPQSYPNGPPRVPGVACLCLPDSRDTARIDPSDSYGGAPPRRALRAGVAGKEAAGARRSYVAVPAGSIQHGVRSIRPLITDFEPDPDLDDIATAAAALTQDPTCNRISSTVEGVDLIRRRIGGGVAPGERKGQVCPDQARSRQACAGESSGVTSIQAPMWR